MWRGQSYAFSQWLCLQNVSPASPRFCEYLVTCSHSLRCPLVPCLLSECWHIFLEPVFVWLIRAIIIFLDWSSKCLSRAFKKKLSPFPLTLRVESA
jgi:hypothetical protein